MLKRLLSNDFPRSRVLAVMLAVLFIALLGAPFIFPGVKALNVAAKVLVFIVLVASFDLLLGYTGIVHTRCFLALVRMALPLPARTWGRLGALC